MSKEQIEEMAEVLEITERKKMDSHCDLPSVEEYATDLYEAGYRKQSRANWESDDAFLRYRRHYRCSACGYYVERMQNFCPKCGAKMRKEDEGK